MANAAYDFETIYAPDGNEHKCSRLNAIDLVRTAGYSWRRPAVSVAAIRAVVEPEPVTAPIIEETLPEAITSADPVDVVEGELDEVAAALAGTDARTYLNGFSVDALKTIAEQRYGEKLVGTSKKKLIDTVLQLEEARSLA